MYFWIFLTRSSEFIYSHFFICIVIAMIESRVISWTSRVFAHRRWTFLRQMTNGQKSWRIITAGTPWIMLPEFTAKNNEDPTKRVS